MEAYRLITTFEQLNHSQKMTHFTVSCGRRLPEKSTVFRALAEKKNSDHEAGLSLAGRFMPCRFRETSKCTRDSTQPVDSALNNCIINIPAISRTTSQQCQLIIFYSQTHYQHLVDSNIVYAWGNRHRNWSERTSLQAVAAMIRTTIAPCKRPTRLINYTDRNLFHTI